MFKLLALTSKPLTLFAPNPHRFGSKSMHEKLLKNVDSQPLIKPKICFIILQTNDFDDYDDICV